MRFPFIQSPGQRAALLTQDDLVTNCYPEQLQDGRFALVKRKGVSEYHATGNAATPRGMWLFNGELVSIFGSKLFHGTTEIGTNAIAGSGPVWADEYGTTTKYLALGNGSAANNSYRLSTAWALTTVTDADMQTHVAGISHLDGYLFTLASSGQIMHSDLRDFTAWTAANVINAESYPDTGTRICRHLNYIAAIGDKSIEFFYDAANTTGSVLNRVSGAILTVGCQQARTFAEIKGVQFFVSNAGAVYALANMQHERISTPSIERIIQNATLTDAYAQAFEIPGHVFYMLTLPTTNVTMAFDVVTKRWWKVEDPSGNYWPYVNAVNNGTQVYFQHISNGKIYKYDTNQDAGSNFTILARTAFVDFGTSEPKQLASIECQTDIGAGNLSIRYSKNDFSSWSTARTVSTAGRTRLYAFGQMRRVAFEFSHTHNEAMRLIDVDLEIMPAKRRRK